MAKTTNFNLTELKPNLDNPRFISDEKLEELKTSITKFKRMMELRPIIYDEDMVILGGNMRYTALMALKRHKVPPEWVKQVVGLTAEEKREFIIKDNVGFGEWDWEVLHGDWDTEKLGEWGLDVVPFEEDTVLEGKEDDFDVPVGGSETDIVLGDLIEIGHHRLLCGSSTETDTWEKVMDGKLCDLVVTDPPYNVDYTGKTKDSLKIENDKKEDSDFYQFLYDFYTALGAYTKKGGAWYVWHADSEGANFRSAMANSGIMVKQCLIWVKNSMVMGRQDYHWQHEPCLYGWKEGAAHSWFTDRKQTTVMNFDRPSRNTEHPTMKPIPLISYQITNSSKQGDLVCDGFLGSGTTMVAAHQLERTCFGMELDPKYCQVIVDRMMKLDADLVVKINGKKYKKK